ncbi:MAG: AI-2E family transporter [Lachnospiraceae bacterium]|nr:AI-2E family transporter [Lachnospiraceae bacterium]
MEFNKKNIRIILLLAAAIILMYQLVDNVNNILGFLGICLQMVFPFILGLGIAFIFNVPMRFIEEQMERRCKSGSFLYKRKRIISFVLTLFFVLGVLLLVALLVVPQLTTTITQVIEQVPKFNKEVTRWLHMLQRKIPKLGDTIGNLEHVWDVIGRAMSKLSTSQIAGMFSSTVGIISGVVSGITTFFIAIIFAFYVLFQKETLSEQCKKLLYSLFPITNADRTIGVMRMADRTFSNFLVGQCTEAFILGMMFIISMAIFGLPYSVMIGVLIGVMSLVPIVGAFVGCFVGAFLILMVDPMQALFFVILFLVLQQIEGNLIYPHVVGNSVGLPSIWVLAAVTLGGNLMGVSGMILGIPLVSIMYTMLSDFVHARLKTRKIAEVKWKNSDKTADIGTHVSNEKRKKRK